MAPVSTDEERCAEFRKFERIDEAFRTGTLSALRAAVDDPSVIPNGRMPDTIGTCLVYAIYRSPVAFIRTLLEIGADPNAPADDGFPPLIAALSCTRDTPGAARRADVDDIIRLLLSFGADPNQRGINDYTALHMAVAEGNALAVQRLLDAGADAERRTRIDECETPLDMARAAGSTVIAAMLERRGQAVRQRLRSGLTLLVDIPGTGEPVRRQGDYRIRLRLWLAGGAPVRWTDAWGPVGAAALSDHGETLVTEVRINRGQLMNGLFYGVEGMRVGGTRRLEITPHLGFGSRGIPGIVPPGATLVAEVTVIAERSGASG
jgi:hypothetical protein